MIKQYQYRKFGIQICNGLTNQHRKLVIEASEDLLIPMAMEGSTLRLVTHPPTDEELYEYQRIFLSDEFDWDPSIFF